MSKFFLTENLSNSMRLIDKWTVLMVIVFVIQVIIMVFLMKKGDNDDEEENEATAAELDEAFEE